MSDLETPITTQEQLDKIIGERVRREQKKFENFISPEDFDKRAKEKADEIYKAKTDEYAATIAELKKSVDEKTAAISKHDEEVAGLSAKIKSYETSAVKQRVAHETGIPYELASRLNGETEEDIRKDAEALAKLVQRKSAPPLRSDDPDKINSSREALKKTLREMKGE